MPPLKRRTKRKRDGWGEDVVEHLREGSCLPCMFGQVDHSGEKLKPAWEELKHQVLPEFVRQHPGERPWAWWEFDAPGRRERTDGGIHPFDNKERTLYVAKSDNPEFWRVAYRLSFGYPSAFIGPWDAGLNASWFEQSWEYLVRHNLLLPEDSP